ncbi:hypothetical protein C7T36_14495 [Rhodococcus sp. AD45-ID]|uniref:membrane protein n=1 Tax=unclassified Rhodococcus (in: high G+C Gram-positive bacteria) TaxID=192944 RepID=UPI0005D34F09|nr:MULTISPECIES: membrane protein [unclassified Rhodococcus (in: high G+C Gram-positive bacteria)]KJF25049.1 hypothetical protein SZ00_01975 [Rhodococcus sp. AD45]PSR43258.1 hypothetical protein C7T36_14495 [Rhodococcus sp. AD45-ID]
MSTANNTENTHRQPSLLGRRLAVGGLAAVVVGAVAGTGWVWFSGSENNSRAVAIVNTDAGTMLDGEELRAGDTLVETLSASEDFDFHVVDSPGGNYFATLTVPENFSESVASMLGPEPQQASIDLDVQGADGAQAVALTSAVSAQVSADGIKGLMSQTSAARRAFDQNLVTAQMLVAGTAGAEKSIDQVKAGADTILPYLETARAGSLQLTSVAEQVSGVVDQAAGSAEELATRADSLGLTLGEASSSTADLKSRIDSLTGALSGLPVPQDITAQLASVSTDLGAVTAQLNAVPSMLGGSVGPDTALGDLVRTAVGQLQGASAQLNSAAGQLSDGLIPIADQAPQMLEDVTTQITQGFGTLKSVATSLVTGLDTAKSGLPALTTPQQVQLMSVLSDPVAVNQTPAPGSGSDSRTIALVFGVATALLAGALLTQTAAPLVKERRRIELGERD